jgi:tRNA 2-thiouridine synthesizing protein D
MKFSILIKSSPYQQQGALSAQGFIRAALRQGHTVWRVFFYHEGVYNASAHSMPPQDESNVIDNWVQLAAHANIELVICSTAGMRRGVLDADTAGRHDRGQGCMHSAFRTGSLLLLVDAMADSDRFMVFEG